MFVSSLTILLLVREWLSLDSDEQVIRIQDKGSKFLIPEKTEYCTKMLGQLEYPLHYKTLDLDPSANYVITISGWSNKWLHKGQIDQDITYWIVNSKARPGKAFGTINTHKVVNPVAAIDNLSVFTEFYVKPLAQKLPSFVKDTTHLLQKIEDLNRHGPFPEGTLLVPWDVVLMLPNIDNDLGIKAVTDALIRMTFKFHQLNALLKPLRSA